MSLLLKPCLMLVFQIILWRKDDWSHGIKGMRKQTRWLALLDKLNECSIQNLVGRLGTWPSRLILCSPISSVVIYVEISSPRKQVLGNTSCCIKGYTAITVQFVGEDSVWSLIMKVIWILTLIHVHIAVQVVTKHSRTNNPSRDMHQLV